MSQVSHLMIMVIYVHLTIGGCFVAFPLHVLITPPPLPQPPNEWGSYYTLPNEFASKEEFFTYAYADYQTDSNNYTECKQADAALERWFVSSRDDTVFVMSYHCRTTPERTTQHLKVQNKDGVIRVLDFQKSLRVFGITSEDATYEISKEGCEAKKVQETMLRKVRDQVKKQKNPFDASTEMCPGAAVDTIRVVETKKFNDLYYSKFPISCGYSGYGGNDYMTYIEIVEDKDYHEVNRGYAALVAMGIPERNSQFVRQKQEEEKC